MIIFVLPRTSQFHTLDLTPYNLPSWIKIKNYNACLVFCKSKPLDQLYDKTCTCIHMTNLPLSREVWLFRKLFYVKQLVTQSQNWGLHVRHECTWCTCRKVLCNKPLQTVHYTYRCRMTLMPRLTMVLVPPSELSCRLFKDKFNGSALIKK